MAKPLDYSKWDKIEGLDSDEEEENRPRAPQVTKFEKPMSVRIGPEGEAGETDYESKVVKAPTAPLTAPSPVPGDSSAQGATAATISSVPPLKRKVLEPTMLFENGSELERYMWSQSRKEAVLRVWVPAGTRAKDVTVEHVGSKLTVSLKGDVLISGELANAIHVEAETGLDWELADSLEGPGGRRLVEITMVKQTPRDDMIHWWKQVFRGDPEIDTTKIRGRSHGFQDAWKEAQAMFLERVKEKQQLPVEM